MIFYVPIPFDFYVKRFLVGILQIFTVQRQNSIVKPFIDRLNRNELFTAICSGMASIAGSTMIGYAALGVPVEYLLAASLMAIPGGILFARLLSPATESSQVSFNNLSFTETPPKSIIEALRTMLSNKVYGRKKMHFYAIKTAIFCGKQM